MSYHTIHSQYVTISAKTRIVRTSTYFEKKFLCEITHTTGRNLQGLMGPAISEGSFKSTKLYTILLTRVRKSLFRLCSLNSEVSCVFV